MAFVWWGQKKINTSFFKIALESLWETRPYSYNTFPYSTSPIIIITFQRRLKEVVIPHYDFWHLLLHFSSILHRLYLNWNADQEVIFQVLISMVFLFIRNARLFGQVQEYQSVHLLIEASFLLSLIHSWKNVQWLAKPKLYMTKELKLNESYNFNNKLAITMLGFCRWFLGCCYEDFFFFLIFCSLDSRLNGFLGFEVHIINSLILRVRVLLSIRIYDQ